MCSRSPTSRLFSGSLARSVRTLETIRSDPYCLPTRNASPPSFADQLCGHCGNGQAAISPSGEVWPCVFSRWMPVGNVRETPLGEILAGPRMTATDAELRTHFATRTSGACDPQCGPNCGPSCNPSCWSGPCGPRDGCMPNYDS